ncbi:MAG: hypothetical protein AAFY82_09005 [Pseudomonadota bacterium]
MRDLDEALAQRGAALHIRTHHVIEALTAFHSAQAVLSVHAHAVPEDRETERAVEAWCLRAGVSFRLQAAPGPDAWHRYMSAPRHEMPAQLKAADLGVGHKLYLAGLDPEAGPQTGRKAAIKQLRAGLGQLSDLSAIAAPGRLSGDQVFAGLAPHLELGVLSVREVWQAAIRAQHQYHLAGQDIRAARISRLLERLQARHQPGDARRLDRTHSAEGLAQSHLSAHRDGQLTLDLGPSA